MMKLSYLKSAGHWPTLVTAFLYFDFSFMVWTLLGALGVQIAETLGLTAQQKGLMVAMPILSDACLRIVMGLVSDARKLELEPWLPMTKSGLPSPLKSAD